MFSFNSISIALFSVMLLVTLALHVHAEELEGNPVSVRGLVVSSGHELLINDGVRDYVLLGVDTSNYEGKICEAFGVVVFSEGRPTIEVRTLTIIADTYPDEDLIGVNRRHGNSCSGQCRDGIQGNTMVSPGFAMSFLHSLSLHQRGRGGMRSSGHSSAVACRSHYLNRIKEEQWT